MIKRSNSKLSKEQWHTSPTQITPTVCLHYTCVGLHVPGAHQKADQKLKSLARNYKSGVKRQQTQSSIQIRQSFIWLRTD